MAFGKAKPQANWLHGRSLTSRGNSGRYSFYRLYVYVEPNQRLKRGDLPTPLATFMSKHDMTQDGEYKQRINDFPSAAYLELTGLLSDTMIFPWDEHDPSGKNVMPYAVEICNPLGDCVRRFSRVAEMRLPQPRPDENRIPQVAHKAMQAAARRARGKLPPMHQRYQLICEVEDHREVVTVAIIRVFTDEGPTDEFVYACEGLVINPRLDLSPAQQRDLTEQRKEYFGA